MKHNVNDATTVHIGGEVGHRAKTYLTVWRNKKCRYANNHNHQQDLAPSKTYTADATQVLMTNDDVCLSTMR